MILFDSIFKCFIYFIDVYYDLLLYMINAEIFIFIYDILVLVEFDV